MMRRHTEIPEPRWVSDLIYQLFNKLLCLFQIDWIFLLKALKFEINQILHHSGQSSPVIGCKNPEPVKGDVIDSEADRGLLLLLFSLLFFGWHLFILVVETNAMQS